MLSGCGLFDTRSVEPPIDPRSNYEPPTSPDKVLTNLQSAVSEKNLNNYLKCLVDTVFSTKKYIYTADILSQIQYPIFRYWNYTNEKNYFTNLLSLTNSQSTSILFWASGSTPTIYGDSAVFDSDYLLRIDHQKTNVPKTLTGNVRLVMSLDSRNLWSIHRWIDNKSLDSDTTWSVLRANFSN